MNGEKFPTYSIFSSQKNEKLEEIQLLEVRLTLLQK